MLIAAPVTLQLCEDDSSYSAEACTICFCTSGRRPESEEWVNMEVVIFLTFSLVFVRLNKLESATSGHPQSS